MSNEQNAHRLNLVVRRLKKPYFVSCSDIHDSYIPVVIPDQILKLRKLVNWGKHEAYTLYKIFKVIIARHHNKTAKFLYMFGNI